ncbi:MAG: hypothetical protein JWL57_2643, partial [Actinobacteria bacterium]|nr:hypothetical protein [Actinomycetota bacterium]
MYKASLGLVGIAGIALLIGWLQQNNPATWLAIVASIAAALLLFASWIIDRAKGRTATAGGERTTPTWTPPPETSSTWTSDAPAGQTGAVPPRGLRSSHGPALPTSTPVVASPSRSATPSDTDTDAEESAPHHRFGRRPAAAESGRQDDAVAELQALSESASAQLASMNEEEEAEAPLNQQAENEVPEQRAPQEPDRRAVRGRSSAAQDQWLEAAIRRRETRPGSAESRAAEQATRRVEPEATPEPAPFIGRRRPRAASAPAPAPEPREEAGSPPESKEEPAIAPWPDRTSRVARRVPPGPPAAKPEPADQPEPEAPPAASDVKKRA